MRAGSAAGFLAAVLLLSAFGCGGSVEGPPPVPEGAIPADATIGSATIEGTVRYTGAPPPQPVIDMDSDAACHGGQGSRREDLMVGPDGGVANVFVAVVSGLEDRVFAPPPEPARLDQLGCTYRPHVVGLQVGQALVIRNADPTLHNVHAVASANAGFNFGMSVQGQTATRWFTRPELMIRLKCDVHPWMGAWVGVTANPFFQVTGTDGAFRLDGLPAGTFVVELWHEKLPARRRTVSLTPGGHAVIDLTWPE